MLLTINSRASRAGAYIDTSQPAWIEAVAKARAAVPTLRELFAQREAPIDVKYALQNTDADTEHVWGELLELALARSDGRHIPDHIAKMEKRFVDRPVTNG